MTGELKSPLRAIRTALKLTLEAVVEGVNCIECDEAAAEGRQPIKKWDTGGLSRSERSGVKSLRRAELLVKFFRGHINEIHLLYPDRWQKD